MTHPAQTADRIGVEALLGRGYREYPPNGMDRASRHFSKCFRDEKGKRFHIHFRQWNHLEYISFDAQLCCDTPNDGYLWITTRQDSIEAVEAMFEALWQASGGVYYEAYEETP